MALRIALVSDAWKPQVNGVVRTWSHVIRESEAQGHEFLIVHPGLFKTVGMPRYPDLRLALPPHSKVGSLIAAFRPNAIHIATEGPLGSAGRRYCLRRNIAYTTSYHTDFPNYLKAYYGIPRRMTWWFLRRFHTPARHTLVPTPTVNRELTAHGFSHVVTWSRGVDTEQFCLGPPGCKDILNLPRPIFLTAGRVAIEKNLEAFLQLDLPGSKVVIGDGPARRALQRKFPKAHWLGYLFDQDLARHYAAADVFVFPSRTDTFGVVMLEANACGLPVAAFPVTGPVDVVRHGVTGILDHDLRAACLAACKLDPAACRAYALENSWRRCADTLLEHLAILPARASEPGAYGLTTKAQRAQSGAT